MGSFPVGLEIDESAYFPQASNEGLPDTPRKSRLLDASAEYRCMLPAGSMTCSTPQLTPCAQCHLEPEIWKQKVLDWSQQRENHHLLGHKHT